MTTMGGQAVLDLLDKSLALYQLSSPINNNRAWYIGLFHMTCHGKLGALTPLHVRAPAKSTTPAPCHAPQRVAETRTSMPYAPTARM